MIRMTKAYPMTARAGSLAMLRCLTLFWCLLLLCAGNDMLADDQEDGMQDQRTAFGYEQLPLERARDRPHRLLNAGNVPC